MRLTLRTLLAYLDEILDLARNPRRTIPVSDWHGDIRWERQFSLSPPNGYDLTDAFRKLAFHYLQWNGNVLFIREPYRSYAAW